MYSNKKSIRSTIKDSIDELRGESAQDKESKPDVNYSPASSDERCGDCTYFVLPKKAADEDAEGKCKEVKGAIHPQYWCKLFEAAEEAPEEDATSDQMTIEQFQDR